MKKEVISPDLPKDDEDRERFFHLTDCLCFISSFEYFLPDRIAGDHYPIFFEILFRLFK